MGFVSRIGSQVVTRGIVRALQRGVIGNRKVCIIDNRQYSSVVKKDGFVKTAYKESSTSSSDQKEGVLKRKLHGRLFSLKGKVNLDSPNILGLLSNSLKQTKKIHDSTKNVVTENYRRFSKNTNWRSFKSNSGQVIKVVRQIQGATKGRVDSIVRTARFTKFLGISFVGCLALLTTGYFIRSCTGLYKTLKVPTPYPKESP